MQCPLCNNWDVEFFAEDKHKRYQHCASCDMIFVEPDFLPGFATEKQRYLQHQNNPEDKKYVDFLSRIIEPLSDLVEDKASGLDFGCGPEPVLAKLLQNRGFDMQVYDPIFVPDESVLNRNYDFVITTEVVEHLHNPGKVFNQIFQLLKPDAPLAVMTKLFTADIDFESWHYKNDLTHVCFYSIKTMNWIATRFNRKLNIVLPDLVFFT